WDVDAVRASVRKTGRLVIAQEDGATCSLGQAIISTICGDPQLFEALVAPPILVAKPDIHIGYSHVYEYTALPDAARVSKAIRDVMSSQERKHVSAPIRPMASGGVTAGQIITNAFAPEPEEITARSALKEITI